jgi:hypothetical protein
MEQDPKPPPFEGNSPHSNAPPPISPAPPHKPSSGPMAVLLSLCLGLFLADAVVSFVDDSLILFFDIYVLAALRRIFFLFACLMTVVVYILMGFTPIIPKRLFLPVTLFNPLAALLLIPFLIYFFDLIHQASWIISLCQVILALSIFYLAQGRSGLKFRWPLVAERHLGTRRFSWLNLSVFLLVNVVVLLPGIIVYFALCSSLAVDHFSDGFMALRTSGLTVQARKYVRDDGKTIQLFPMSHVGDSAFYRNLTQSFPTNSITLMEGVTDNQNLLTNKITYKRMANSLGLAEQQQEFRPQGEMVRADVDVEQFTTNTIDLLNLVMLLHSKGMNPDVLLKLTQYSPPPHFEKELFDDLLRKRNRRLLEEIQVQLAQSENLIVPWGVAHMPEIAKEIQKSGFRLLETKDYVAVRFGSDENIKVIEK